MSSERVQFAIQLPKRISTQLRAMPPASAGVAVSLSEKPVGSDFGRDLKFDPVTGDPMVWVLMSVTGQAVIDFVVNVLGALTASRLEAAEKSGLANYEVEVRLGNGEIWKVTSRNPIDVSRLRRTLVSK